MIDLNEYMGEFTVVARKYGVRIKGMRRWYWRMRLGLGLLRLGAAVMGMGYEELDVEEGE